MSVDRGLLVLAFGVVAAGALNNVLGKIRAKPLEHVDFFVTLLNAGVYSVVYFTILAFRVYKGYTSSDQISYVLSSKKEGSWWARIGDIKYIILAGALDATGNALNFISQPHVSGPYIPILNQTTLIFSVLVGVTMLRKRYTLAQVAAVFVSISGAIVMSIPEISKLFDPAAPSTTEEEHLIFYASLMVLSNLPTAFSYALKEKIFTGYKDMQKKNNEADAVNGNTSPLNAPLLNETATSPPASPIHPTEATGAALTAPSGPTAVALAVVEDEEAQTDAQLSTPASTPATSSSRPVIPLDIFIVNSFTSLCSIFFVPALLPINIALGKTKGLPLLDYTQDAFQCLSGSTPDWMWSDRCSAFDCCAASPPSYLAYITANILFNILMLSFLRKGSAVFTFVAMKLIAPVTVFLYLWPNWPLLTAKDTKVTIWAIPALVLALAGVFWFREASLRKERVQKDLYDGEEPNCLFPLRKSRATVKAKDATQPDQE